MIDYRDSLLSEIHELQQMLKGLPAEAVIQRISFENRLKGARKALEQESLNPTPSRVMLTFRGRPVDGSRGVDDPDLINRGWLKRDVDITLDVVQVGQGRPRFTLNSLDLADSEQ